MKKGLKRRERVFIGRGQLLVANQAMTYAPEKFKVNPTSWDDECVAFLVIARIFR